jgi:hypothetical protein
MTDIFEAHKKWRDAYTAWVDEAHVVLGPSAPVKAMQGEPGTELRRLYDEVEAAANAYDAVARSIPLSD